MLLAALTTGHTIGLSVTAAIFVAFALLSSFVAPRRWPDFPGEHGMPVFIIASVVLFGAMLTAVEFFAVEEEARAEHAAPAGERKLTTITVRESEYRISLPALKTLSPGDYTFVVENVGKQTHDLVVEGGTPSTTASTPQIAPGKEATLKVALSKGSWTLYCSVDGHRALGMLAKIAVG